MTSLKVALHECQIGSSPFVWLGWATSETLVFNTFRNDYRAHPFWLPLFKLEEFQSWLKISTRRMVHSRILIPMLCHAHHPKVQVLDVFFQKSTSKGPDQLPQLPGPLHQSPPTRRSFGSCLCWEGLASFFCAFGKIWHRWTLWGLWVGLVTGKFQGLLEISHGLRGTFAWKTDMNKIESNRRNGEL